MLHITYNSTVLPVMTLNLKLTVGTEPSYCHLYCLQSQVAAFKTAIKSTLVFWDDVVRRDSADAAISAITLTNMYFVSARSLGSSGSEDLCELILADARMAWKGTTSQTDKNTFVLDRTATATYAINSVSRTLAEMENLNSDEPYTFEDLATAWSATLVNTPFPSNIVPRQILCKGRSLAEMWQQLLWQSNCYMAYDPATGFSIYRLGDYITADATAIAKFSAYKQCTHYTTLGLPALMAGTQINGIAACALDFTDTNPRLREKIYENVTPANGSLIYEYTNIEPIVDENEAQLVAWYTEWTTRIASGIENQSPIEEVYGGLLPIAMSSETQEVEWRLSKTECVTIRRKFYSPTPRPSFEDTYHSNDMFPSGGGGGGSSAALYGRIVRKLLWPDPAGDPAAGYSRYLVQLIATEGITEWAVDQELAIGDLRILTDGIIVYESLSIHTATEANKPPAAAFWKIAEEVDPHPLCTEGDGYDVASDVADLRYFVPWYQEDDEVPLVTRMIDDVQYYFFNLQMMPTHKKDDEGGVEGKGSIRWNDTDNRIMAVFT